MCWKKHQIVIWRYAEIKNYNHRKMIIVYFAVQIMKRRSLPSDGRESLLLRWGRSRALVKRAAHDCFIERGARGHHFYLEYGE